MFLKGIVQTYQLKLSKQQKHICKEVISRNYADKIKH